MVAKIKSSFLKNSFQLFCYKNFIEKDDGGGGGGGGCSGDDGSGLLNRLNGDNSLRTSTPYSKSSPNLNLGEFNHHNNGYNYPYNSSSSPTYLSSSPVSSSSTNSSSLNTSNSGNSARQPSSKHTSKQTIKESQSFNDGQSTNGNHVAYKSDRSDYYMNNRKQLSKLLKDNNGRLLDININTTDSNHKKPRSFNNETDSKSTINKSATLPINTSSSAANCFVQNSFNDNNNRHSYTPSAGQSDDEMKISNGHASQATCTSFKADLLNKNSSVANSQLYKNHSIAGLKAAKKAQMMNKMSDENASGRHVNYQQMGRRSGDASSANSRITPRTQHFKSSILCTAADARRSLSATAANKKVVRFADSLGLDLESTITLNSNGFHNTCNNPVVRKLQKYQAISPPVSSLSNNNYNSNYFAYNSNNNQVNQNQEKFVRFSFSSQQQQFRNAKYAVAKEIENVAKNTTNDLAFAQNNQNSNINNAKSLGQHKGQNAMNNSKTPVTPANSNNNNNNNTSHKYTNNADLNDDTKFYDDLMNHLTQKNANKTSTISENNNQPATGLTNEPNYIQVTNSNEPILNGAATTKPKMNNIKIIMNQHQQQLQQHLQQLQQHNHHQQQLHTTLSSPNENTNDKNQIDEAVNKEALVDKNNYQNQVKVYSNPKQINISTQPQQPADFVNAKIQQQQQRNESTSSSVSSATSNHTNATTNGSVVKMNASTSCKSNQQTQSNGGNLTIKTRINNGKLESEV